MNRIPVARSCVLLMRMTRPPSRGLFLKSTRNDGSAVGTSARVGYGGDANRLGRSQRCAHGAAAREQPRLWAVAQVSLGPLYERCATTSNVSWWPFCDISQQPNDGRLKG